MIKPTALIVDDSKTALNIQCAMVERCGFNVSSCLSGEEAVSLLMLHEKVYDLIVIDYEMDTLSGLEFGRILKQSEIHRDTPLLMLTGTSDDEIEKRCLEIGFMGCFHKEHDRGEKFVGFVKGVHDRFVNMVAPLALVVDDSAVSLSLLKSLVEILGFEVRTARSGVEAMHMITSDHEPFKLFVIDYSMDVMDGLELGGWVRGRDMYDGIPMYMITAACDEALEVKSKEAGFQGCFHKDSKMYIQFKDKLEGVYNELFQISGKGYSPLLTKRAG